MLKEHCQNTEWVYLGLNQLTPKGLNIIIEGMMEMKKLTYFDISGNDISDEIIPSIIKLVLQSENPLSISLDGYVEYLHCLGDQDFPYYQETTANRKITDNAIEMLRDALIGNTNLKSLGLCNQVGITDESVPLLKELAQHSAVDIELNWTSISQENQAELADLFNKPIEERQIPIHSKSKSAAKV